MIDILVTGRPAPALRAALADRFRLHEIGDHAGAIGTIRAIAAFGGASAALIDSLPVLEIVASFGVGYDSVDTAAAARRGIVVTNTPDVLTDEVADTAMGLLLMTVRELSAAERWLRAGRWLAEGPYPLTRGSLRGRRLGILGFGRIGQAIARRAEAFGLPVAYHNRRPVPGATQPWHDSPLSLAGAVDTLVCVLPGGASTRHAVNAAVLAALGPDGILVSMGRGTSVDEAALVAALEAGQILGAGLDVYENEPAVHPGLCGRDDVVLLPHVGSASIATRAAMGALQRDNLLAWFAGKDALTAVPETPSPRRGT